ncbi:MAG TPA: DUF3299 domain-containing protein [Candidatus Limnocylindria bacterium]|jgi:hypothetical protein|nr:DUF3299 domain-containing protein [Candidatus Limnocylindria bacterium]
MKSYLPLWIVSLGMALAADRAFAAEAVVKPAGTNEVRGARITPLNKKPADPSSTDKAAAAPATDTGLLGFDRLAGFKYDLPDDGKGSEGKNPDDQIPAALKDVNGKKVAIKGFMLPLKVEGGLVTELLLMRDQSMCCYATVPKINEWVSVKMTGGVKAIMDQPITLHGTIKIGAVRENGYIVCIYQMDGDKMDGPTPGS